MPASIVLQGLAANDPVPGNYIEVDFAQGPVAGFQGERSVLLLGNSLSAGIATQNTVVYGPDTNVPLQTEADCITLFGAGSELHRMFRRFAKVNNQTKLYALAIPESSGVQATGTITIATNATANGNLRVWVGDEFVDTAILKNDTPTNIGDHLVTNLNANSHWPVTAANSSGTVTLTANQKGLRGNWIRFMTAISANIGTTATGGTDSFLTGGTTADSNVTALATILARRFFYLVSAAEDATQFGALVSQVNTQALPTNGIRQKAFAASVDTLANATTIATGINAALAKIVWQKAGLFTPAELAANQAAVESLEELSNPPSKLNFCGYGNDATSQPNWKVPGIRLNSALPTRSDIKSALNNGLTPIGFNSNNTTYLVDRITSRSLNGSVNDYRIRDDHKVTICLFYADDLNAKLSAQFAGKQIGNDPAPGQLSPPPSVVTPKVVAGAVNRLTKDYAENGLVQNVDQVIAGTIVQRESSPTTRMSVLVPLQPIDILKQTATLVQQVS